MEIAYWIRDLIFIAVGAFFYALFRQWFRMTSERAARLRLWIRRRPSLYSARVSLSVVAV